MDVSLNDWFREWHSMNLARGNDETYLDAIALKVEFVSIPLAFLFWSGFHQEERFSKEAREFRKHRVRVVGEFAGRQLIRSPVFMMNRPDIGLMITMGRNAAFGWNLSVESAVPMDGLDVGDGYKGDGSVVPDFLGFPKSSTFGTLAEDPRRFSLSPYNDYELYSFVRGLVGRAKERR